jgi:hypothetical protein
VVGDVKMDEFSTVVSKAQESEEQVEGEGRAILDVAHLPCTGNGEPSDLMAKESEFGLDPAPAPGRVLSGHAADQRAELKIERRATQRPRDFQRQ